MEILHIKISIFKVEFSVPLSVFFGLKFWILVAQNDFNTLTTKYQI